MQKQILTHSVPTTIGPSSKELLQNYLNRIGVPRVEDLTYQQKRILFVTAVGDFLSNKFTLEELSNIAMTLWESLSNFDRAATDLGDILFECNEAACEICSGETRKMITYFERFKSLALHNG